MQNFYIECGYKGTDGRIKVEGQEFEGATAAEAFKMAKAFYTKKIAYRRLEDMIFSTPQAISSEKGSVSIGGSAVGATIVTGNGNQCIGVNSGGVVIGNIVGNIKI